mmetsp:Transcript_46387/g.86663  ORF Transcript_46387/g.86663 Transcript_46387/m.86663 type:complete len:213 (+) Transcript_46387:44-682(+)
MQRLRSMAQTTIAAANSRCATVEDAIATVLALVAALGIFVLGLTMAVLSSSQGMTDLTVMAMIGVGTYLLLCMGALRMLIRKCQQAEQPGNEGFGGVSAVWASCNFAQLRSATPVFSQFRIQVGQPPSASIEIVAGGEASLPHGKVALACDHDACYCCLSGFEPKCRVALLPCGHVFHETCIASWCLTDSPNASACPVCRCKYCPDMRKETV